LDREVLDIFDTDGLYIRSQGFYGGESSRARGGQQFSTIHCETSLIVVPATSFRSSRRGQGACRRPAPAEGLRM
jgi:hypothetical protein